MPEAVQYIMMLAPTTHFVDISQAVLYRGAGFDVVWIYMVALLAIGTVLFLVSLSHFRKSVNESS